MKKRINVTVLSSRIEVKCWFWIILQPLW